MSRKKYKCTKDDDNLDLLTKYKDMDEKALSSEKDDEGFSWGGCGWLIGLLIVGFLGYWGYTSILKEKEKKEQSYVGEYDISSANPYTYTPSGSIIINDDKTAKITMWVNEWVNDDGDIIATPKEWYGYGELVKGGGFVIHLSMDLDLNWLGEEYEYCATPNFIIDEKKEYLYVDGGAFRSKDPNGRLSIKKR